MGLRWCDSPETFVVFFLCGFLSEINADWGVIAGFLKPHKSERGLEKPSDHAPVSVDLGEEAEEEQDEGLW